VIHGLCRSVRDAEWAVTPGCLPVGRLFSRFTVPRPLAGAGKLDAVEASLSGFDESVPARWDAVMWTHLSVAGRPTSSLPLHGREIG